MELSELPVLCRLPKLELVELPDPQSEEEVDEFETVLLLVSSWHAVAALAAQPPRAAMMKESQSQIAMFTVCRWRGRTATGRRSGAGILARGLAGTTGGQEATARCGAAGAAGGT